MIVTNAMGISYDMSSPVRDAGPKASADNVAERLATLESLFVEYRELVRAPGCGISDRVAELDVRGDRFQERIASLENTLSKHAEGHGVDALRIAEKAHEAIGDMREGLRTHYTAIAARITSLETIWRRALDRFDAIEDRANHFQVRMVDTEKRLETLERYDGEEVDPNLKDEDSRQCWNCSQFSRDVKFRYVSKMWLCQECATA